MQGFAKHLPAAGRRSGIFDRLSRAEALRLVAAGLVMTKRTTQQLQIYIVKHRRPVREHGARANSQ